MTKNRVVSDAKASTDSAVRMRQNERSKIFASFRFFLHPYCVTIFSEDHMTGFFAFAGMTTRSVRKAVKTCFRPHLFLIDIHRT